ncbi:16S rRNA (guanine(966)-N(2))-methyltransferase RsmD [Rhodoferax ferrireducens]|uniref:16S rRNA (Guanine(966)-N(2))-methyltransferase RsmD n=1 Tax=Rhodoferax ferrireducens TaxID=192843 RepID=A0ABU2CCR9_9BURK|nr:16S rRNA (guanine(966)-N(2))-methyltransferase RsmD [Rhodoferax ferrireducens]MDR7379126.1 16S rRNA (guanine(966)-N(2))-methyltransferase RsmD [Rhodoferax ferrireducens]
MSTLQRPTKQAPKKTKPRPSDPHPTSGKPGEIRIIGGQWKRIRLTVASKPGLRPTPDRVRETLFNWLGQDLGGWRCVDVFAGTGVLGFEAASRGAAEVHIFEQDPALVAQLKATQIKLQAGATQIQRGDGVAALRQLAPASVDLVFLDPPFESGLYEPALGAAAKALQPKGFVYLEGPSKWTDELLAPFGLRVYRYLKAGAVHAHLLQAQGANVGDTGGGA